MHTTNPEGSSCSTAGGSGGRQPQVEGQGGVYSIIENAVASLSAVTLDKAPLEKLTLKERIQTPMPDDYATYAERQRQKRRRNQAAKAAKLQQPAKEPEAPVPDIVSNNQFLYETWQSL